MSTPRKKLYRSNRDRYIAGVCGGLADYLDIDPVLIRVAWVGLALMGGFGLLLYLFWIFIVPVETDAGTPVGRRERSGNGGMIVGSILILIGLMVLADHWFWFDLDRLWDMTFQYAGPAILIAGGVWLIRRAMVQKDEPEPEPVQPAEEERAERRHSNRMSKSATDRKLFGVCGGIAEHTDVDPTIVRLLFVGLTLASPPVGIITYIALAILLPAGSVHSEPMGTQTAS